MAKDYLTCLECYEEELTELTEEISRTGTFICSRCRLKHVPIHPILSHAFEDRILETLRKGETIEYVEVQKKVAQIVREIFMAGYNDAIVNPKTRAA